MAGKEGWRVGVPPVRSPHLPEGVVVQRHRAVAWGTAAMAIGLASAPANPGSTLAAPPHPVLAACGAAAAPLKPGPT